MPAQETLQALQFLAGLEQQQVGFGAYGDGPATRRLREFVVGKNHPRSLGSRYDDAVSMEARNADLMAADQRQREMRLQAGLQGQYAEQQFRHRMAEQQQGIEDQQALERTRWQQPGGAGGQNSKEREMRLLAELNEEAAKNKFDREAEMAGIRSRYDLQGHKEKFGFDRTLSDMETDRQFGYLDRQNKLAVDLNEQKFTQSQKLAQQQINDAFNEQFDMGLAEVRGKAGNLTPAGDEILKKIEAKVATLDASAEIMDERWQKSAKDEIVGLMKQMGNPRLLKPSTFKRGDKEFTEDKKGDWIEVNKKPTIMPLGPEHAQYGWVAVDDGRVTVSGQPQRNTAQSSSSDSYLDDMRAIGEIAGKAQKPALDANGRQILGVDGKPVYVPVTWDEAAKLFDSRRSTGQGQGQLGGMNQLPKAVGGMNPAMGAGAAMAPGAQMPPQQPGMMQRGPQAQPPRPQNMMPNPGQSFQQAGIQGGNQQQPPVNPQVPVEVQNAARFVQEMKAQYPDPNAMPPEAQRAIEQAVSIVRQFKSGGR